MFGDSENDNRDETKDAVDHPSHYLKGGMEVIDVIENWELPFHLGCVIKYILRAGRKGDYIEDLKKAQWYLQRKIEKCESEKSTDVTSSPSKSSGMSWEKGFKRS